MADLVKNRRGSSWSDKEISHALVMKLRIVSWTFDMHDVFIFERKVIGKVHADLQTQKSLPFFE